MKLVNRHESNFVCESFKYKKQKGKTSAAYLKWYFSILVIFSSRMKFPSVQIYVYIHIKIFSTYHAYIYGSYKGVCILVYIIVNTHVRDANDGAKPFLNAVFYQQRQSRICGFLKSSDTPLNFRSTLNFSSIWKNTFKPPLKLRFPLLLVPRDDWNSRFL